MKKDLANKNNFPTRTNKRYSSGMNLSELLQSENPYENKLANASTSNYQNVINEISRPRRNPMSFSFDSKTSTTGNLHKS